MNTYEVSHPQLSEPLTMESEGPRQSKALGSWATMYILRNYDEMIPHTEWTITEVTP